MIVVLDSGPAGLIIHPKGSAESRRCIAWLEAMILAGHNIALPEIVDYELRREMLRLRNATSLRRLDQLAANLEYLPITTPVLRRAAELSAISRQRGRPTAGERALDIDMILVAQAMFHGDLSRDSLVIATANVRHLDRFVAARLWAHIS